MAEFSGAQRRWELENEVQETTDVDAIYKWDDDEQRRIQSERPWSKDPNHFKRVKISALALLKMAMHAKSGGNIEVMGVMQGKVQGDTFIVIDAFALPVEGTETRVNAAAEAYEYMVDFQETAKSAGRKENIVGWYHSHPGYGCWLSGIDVGTQMTNQRYQEPFLAVVIDPHRTIAAGKVELGAFRTYPEDYKPQDEPESKYQTIPMDKIEDFGVHAKQYYQLEVSYFKSCLDSHLLDGLWGRYWASTLSSSPLLAMRELIEGQIVDVARKLEAITGQQFRGRGSSFRASPIENTTAFGLGKSGNRSQSKLGEAAEDGVSVASELLRGLSTQLIRQIVFNQKAGCNKEFEHVGNKSALSADMQTELEKNQMDTS